MFSEEFPSVLLFLCPPFRKSLRVETKYGLDYSDFWDGNMFPENEHNISTEELFEEALNEHY